MFSSHDFFLNQKDWEQILKTTRLKPQGKKQNFVTLNLTDYEITFWKN